MPPPLLGGLFSRIEAHEGGVRVGHHLAHAVRVIKAGRSSLSRKKKKRTHARVYPLSVSRGLSAMGGHWHTQVISAALYLCKDGRGLLAVLGSDHVAADHRGTVSQFSWSWCGRPDEDKLEDIPGTVPVHTIIA